MSEEKRPAVREGRWDCTYCRTTAILGRHRACPNCGQVRPENVKFYLPADAEAVTDAQLEQRARRGADWVCSFCTTSNEATADTCRQCGASRADSLGEQKVQTFAMNAVPRAGDNAPSPPRPATPAAPAQQRSMLPIFAALGVLLLLCVGGFLFLGNRESSVRVDGFAWERAITIEERRTVTESDWDLPGAARLISQQEEIHHYVQVVQRYETRTRDVTKQVQVGTRTYVCEQRDLGNGFFEDVECEEPVYENRTRTETYEEPIYRDVPIYRTKYTYEVDKWVSVRTERESGENREPFWPQLSLLDNQRESERSETYLVSVVDDQGNRHEMEVDESRWQALEMEGRYNVRLGLGGEPVEFAEE
ncbi:MAG: hypothetical protein HC876_00975 [Chloroflexaceae bacterium]|nr:hypothetical protein [Chloroflexaceae bacterium]